MVNLIKKCNIEATYNRVKTMKNNKRKNDDEITEDMF